MGIHNFCKLIDPIAPPSSKPGYFDSLLIDCQSFLYLAIEYSLETQDARLFEEIVESVWHQLSTLLNEFRVTSPLTVILSFDGEGVPMKWCTQRERRQRSTRSISQKSFYRYILLGHNTLTQAVEQYLWEKFKTLDRNLTVVLGGCNVPGEGEHKMFQIAESMPQCQHPMVISIDQDVFILAFLRRHRYQTIQIYRYKRFYSLSQLLLALPYPLERLIRVSFLFGNDFIPTVLGITPDNVANMHRAMEEEEENEQEDPPVTLARFLRNMGTHLRFEAVEFVDRLLVICFWMTYFWVLDYYTLRHFPQQFLENRVYEAFDRNQLLTGLSNEPYSRDLYAEARITYQDMITQPIPHAERHIFMDAILLEKLKSYWIKPENSLCSVLQLTSSAYRGRR